MLENSPIFLLIVLIICAIILIKKCVVEHKFYKELLITNFVLIFAYATVIIFFDVIKGNQLGYNIYTYSSLVVLLLISLFLYLSSTTNLNKKAFLNNILSSLEDNTYYLLLNKKNKIIEISSYLASKFGVEKEKIINKNIIELLDNYITIESINNKSVSNNEFIQYISTTIPANLHSELDLKFIKSDGTEEKITITESSIYTSDKFYGRMYLGVIKPVVVSQEKHDNNKKYNALVNTLNEGTINYHFDTKTLVVNDYLVKKLNLVGNTLSLSDFLYNICEEDFKHLQETIANTTRENSSVSTIINYSYDDGKKVYLKLAFNVLFDGLNKVELVGSLLVNENKQFINLNSSVLDNMNLEDKISHDIKKLCASETKFEVVTFKILDIKEINNTYTRQLGTLVIEEYIRSIINVFNIESYIYRISGTRFAFILTDPRQMEKLTRAVTNNKLLTPTLNYGNTNIKLNVIMGLSFSNDSIRKEEIYSNARYALKKAKEHKKQYIFYKDLLN